MFENAVTLLRIRGIPVRVDASWLIIAVIVTWSLATGFFPYYAPEVEEGYLTMAVAGMVGLFLSIVFHEYCHAGVGRRHGVEVRSITLFVFGGVSEMRNEPPGPRSEFWMAIAGPIGSFALAVAFTAALLVSDALAWPAAAAGLLFWLAWINVLLGGFNLVPAFPLDGGRMLRALLWHRKKSLRWASSVTSRIGAGFGAVLIALGILAFFGGNFLGGVWFALIGLWLRGAARLSYRQVLMRRFLDGERVRDFMTPEVVTVPSSLPLGEMIDDYVYRHRHRVYPVVEKDELSGFVTVDDLEGIDANERERLRVRDVLRPCKEEHAIEPEAGMNAAIRRMQRDGPRALFVVDNGSLQGIVTLRDVTDRLALALELEGEEEIGRSSLDETREPVPG